jgi:hypothetical protein
MKLKLILIKGLSHLLKYFMNNNIFLFIKYTIVLIYIYIILDLLLILLNILFKKIYKKY